MTNNKELMHGGDYNPEQWLDRPDILETDIERFVEAKINTVTLGVFSWAKLEPREGEYDFAWLEKIINNLWNHNISVILATPSGARPHWMADKYPEVLRMTDRREKNLFGFRHNHCLTSPVYREKVYSIDKKLAEHFGNHPAVKLWHISNELGGECHCPLCQNAFRDWLKERYGTIEELNSRWCTTFWSHTYDNFEQVESPSPLGEGSIQALKLDWQRFVSDQTIDFVKVEKAAIRAGGSDKPTCVNMMYHFGGIDYYKLAKEVELVSWDSYPTWNKKPHWEIAQDNGFWHDVICSLKRKPFLLMESCPGQTNWQGVSKLRRPKVVEAASLQAIAHGADGALYFQMRQARGSEEKFHAAVIDHYGEKDSRTYQDVCKAGNMLSKITQVTGEYTKSKVAVIYDWENRWAVENSCGPRTDNMYHEACIEKSYRALRKLGMNVDVVDQSTDLDDYKFVAVPMQYMFHEGFADRLRKFVAQGGTLAMTYWSGMVDENDRCHLGRTPHDLTDVLGLRREEIDGLYDWDENQICKPITFTDKDLTALDMADDYLLHNNAVTDKELNEVVSALKSSYTCKYLCELVKRESATPLMYYGSDFYEGKAALLHNRYEKGQVYYVCADAEQQFYTDLYKAIAKQINLCEDNIIEEIPDGIEVNIRGDYLFLQNYSDHQITIQLPKGEVLYGNPDGVMNELDGIVIKL